MTVELEFQAGQALHADHERAVGNPGVVYVHVHLRRLAYPSADVVASR